MNFKSQDYLARLLAKENLDVIHGNFSTASFDVEGRVLRLPLWKDKGKAVYDLLVGHEVGHALYTPIDGWHDSEKVIPGVPRDMINIIEDIRIEKKIQSTYPGIVRAFKQGYKVLFDDNLFGTEGKDITTYNFMDKLNIYSKGRGYVGVEFNPTEKMFVDLAMGVETWEDVLKACTEINDWLNNKEDYEDDEEQEPQNTIGGDENGDQDDDEKTTQQSSNESNQMDESGSDTELNEGDPIDEIDPEESLTDKAQRDNEGDLLEKDEDGRQPTYSSGMSDDTINKLIVTYDKLRKDRLEIAGAYIHPELPGLYKMMLDSGVTKTVNLMAREFERKKAAWEYSRSTEAKKGSLNTNKLHQYQYSEDIFLSVNRLAQAKSHGMFMLIDFSGSMNGILKDVIKQTITIALFCKKVNIPFEAYSFTTRGNNKEVNLGENDIENVTSLKLVNIISSRLKKKDFNESLMNIFAIAEASDWSSPLRYSHMSNYDRMGGTPLVQSLIASEKIINKFRAETGVQNMNVMILTDGMGDSIRVNNEYRTETFTQRDGLKIKFGNKFIEGKDRDEIQSNTIKLLGKLTNSKVLGFFLCDGKYDFNNGYSVTNIDSWGVGKDSKKEIARKKWTTEGVITYKNVGGYDEYFIVKVGGKKVPTEFEVVDKKGTGIGIKDIKREFRKFNKNAKNSKQLVNKITDAVAA